MKHWSRRGKPVRHHGRVEWCGHADCVVAGEALRMAPPGSQACAYTTRTGRVCVRETGHPGAHELSGK